MNYSQDFQNSMRDLSNKIFKGDRETGDLDVRCWNCQYLYDWECKRRGKYAK